MYDIPHVTKDFGLQLYALQQASGLKQALFADKLGISLAAFYSYVYGKRLPTLTTVLHIANVLNVDLDFLLGLKKDANTINRSILPANRKMAFYLCRNCQHARGSDACIRCEIKKRIKDGKANGKSL